MSYTATAGAGILVLEPPSPPEPEVELVDEPTPDNLVHFQKLPEPEPEPTPAVEPQPTLSEEFTLRSDEVVEVGGEAMVTLGAFERLKNEMSDTFHAAVADVERRLYQTRAEQRRAETGVMEQVFVEDFFDGIHRITGYLLESNAPAAGSIRWSSLRVVYMGEDYAIANGSTANRYVWFVKPATNSGSVTLSTGNTLPNLGPNDALLFVNDSGVARSQTEASLPAAVQPGSVTNEMLSTALASVLTNLQTDVANAQATADGSIVSYFQPDPPWANGTTQDAAKVGDVWYDSDPGGGAYRWSGAAGTPANTWVKIADTDTSGLTQLVNTKVTTYVNNVAPTAPSGGFTTGDFWIDTANGNVTKRWSGSAWVTYQIGDAAISGVGGAKVGSGINAGNVTTGTLAAARVGPGVAGAVLTSATGTVGTSQIANGAVANANLATNAVQPKNINASFHLLY